MACEIIARTDRGIVRRHNEDAVYISSRNGLALVADGMGGYSAGEIASGMAAVMLGDEISVLLSKEEEGGGVTDSQIHQLLSHEIDKVNRAIYDIAQQHRRYEGMGTTVVLGVFYANAATIAHAGDSRCYRLRDNQLEQITRDHSLTQELMDSGYLSKEEAKHSSTRHCVTRVLGVAPTVEAEIKSYDTQVGDIFLLCSDGLSGMLDDSEIQQVILKRGIRLEDMASTLISMSNERGGRDNVTVVLVKINEEVDHKSWWRGSFRWMFN